MQYDVIIIGAGPGGIYSAYELVTRRPGLKIAVFETGHVLEKRKCPIDGKRVKACIGCETCAIMTGFGGAGAFSDGKYNITNDFGGTLYEYLGKETAIELMEYVDEINCRYGGARTKMYSTAGTSFKKKCMQNKLTLLDASVRHLGTDINYIVLEHLYEVMRDRVDFYFDTPVLSVEKLQDGYRAVCTGGSYTGAFCVISAGRSGSKWMETVCRELEIPTKSNRVDLGVRVELPSVIFDEITDELYESKIVYRTEKFEDSVRTFCMNPRGIVVNENTNGIITVNGHSFEDESKKTIYENHCFLPDKHFSSQSLKMYYPDTGKLKADYEAMVEMINNDSLWESENTTSKIDINEVQLLYQNQNFLSVIRKENDELVFSNMLGYFFEQNRPVFVDFAKEVLNIPSVSTDFDVFREKENIDLWIEDDNNVIVIENKIKSKINGERHDTNSEKIQSQLSDYYKYAIDNSNGKQVHAYLFTPDYNHIDLKYYDCGSKYSIVKYSDIYNFYYKNAGKMLHVKDRKSVV